MIIWLSRLPSLSVIVISCHFNIDFLLIFTWKILWHVKMYRSRKFTLVKGSQKVLKSDAVSIYIYIFPNGHSICLWQPKKVVRKWKHFVRKRLCFLQNVFTFFSAVSIGITLPMGWGRPHGQLASWLFPTPSNYSSKGFEDVIVKPGDVRSQNLKPGYTLVISRRSLKVKVKVSMLKKLLVGWPL